MIEAFVTLSQIPNTQIAMTTHSPDIVKMLDFEHLNLISDAGESREITQVEENKLPYPSLNEVNFYAFDEVNDEYHNELYGFIDYNEWLDEYQTSQQETIRAYKRLNRSNVEIELSIILSEYIRHQIHHPENRLNQRYSADDLKQSIQEMRSFIEQKAISAGTINQRAA